MISDTLSDAAAEIRRHQVEDPEVYASHAQEIADVLAAMDRLRIRLDRGDTARGNGQP